MDWWIYLFGGGSTSGAVGFLVGKYFSRRKDRADSSKAEADAIASWQHSVSVANEEMEKARKNSETWYDALQAVRAEMDAKVEAATAGLKAQNAELLNTVTIMAKQLDQRTVSEAQVALAQRQIQHTEQLEAENATLREQVKEIPALRQEVADLRIEVADLRTRLGDTEREQRLDHEVLRRDLDGGNNG